MTRAIGMLSGGLDSTIAVKLMLEQGIEVMALNFMTPFCTCTNKGCQHEATRVSREFGIEIKVVSAGDEYIKMLRNPEHGYGKNMNPCIDCRIFMLKRAKTYMKEIGASFLFTGDVLGQRPMSQRREAMKEIEREAGLEGMILRPLSALYLEPTIPEKEGLVDRDKLLDIKGRGRKPQMELADQMMIKDYQCPAGGCLLTNKEYADKLRDLLKHKNHVTLKDLRLLKVGRHFRYGRNKMIVGRNESENDVLLSMKQKTDYVFEVPDHGSPITLLQGEKTRKAIETAARFTARYSDCTKAKVIVKYGRARPVKNLEVKPLDQEEIDGMTIRRKTGQGTSRDGEGR